jgi:nickel transport protein
MRFATLITTAALTFGAAVPAFAHKLTVFASTDCEVVLVEAKFSSGRIPVKGEVRVLDGENALVTTTNLGKDGTVAIPLDEIDAETGVLIEVDTGGHENYWILTPDDIAKKCQS